jgi:dienelactone hydrolase
MRLELAELGVDGETYEGRLNVPADGGDRGVLVLSGAGHGPFGDIFDVTAHDLAADGWWVYRYESWTDPDELDAKTLGELRREVDAAVEVLRERGCDSVAVIAKSFGCGIALGHVPDAVDRLVLWAPAVEFGVDEAASTAPADRIGEGETLLIGIADLDHVDVPVRILRGTADQGVSRADCATILDAVDDGALTEIPGETHSFNERRRAVIAQTRWYLGAD